MFIYSLLKTCHYITKFLYKYHPLQLRILFIKPIKRADIFRADWVSFVVVNTIEVLQ